MNEGIQRTLLVVEDEVLVAMALERDLRIAGFEVLGRAATGEGAIQFAADRGPDIILMDIRLAGEMDGVEAARIIKSRNDVSIIFMTGYSDADSRTRASAVKPLAYLNKPVEPRTLLRILSGD